ncbi:hypothetical protein PYCC9005_005177 [Savitreella phatthalungensis]
MTSSWHALETPEARGPPSDPHSSSSSAMRRRRRTTAQELVILEREFLRCDKPSMGERERIAREIVQAGGVGMNGREIQVWFQNKRQAIRRVQPSLSASAPHRHFSSSSLTGDETESSPPATDRPHDPSHPRTSITPPALSQSSTAGHGGHHQPKTNPPVPTPDSIAHHSRHHQIDKRKMAGVLLGNLDGRAEVMFSAPPLKPSSPPREPQLVTPIKTPLARKQHPAGGHKAALRSASSPALLGSPMSSLLNSAQAASALQNMCAGTGSGADSRANVPRPGDPRGHARKRSLLNDDEDDDVDDGRTAALQLPHSTRESAPIAKRRPNDTGFGKITTFNGKENVPPALLPIHVGPRSQASPTDPSAYSLSRRVVSQPAPSLNLPRTNGPFDLRDSTFTSLIPSSKLHRSVSEMLPLPRPSHRTITIHADTSHENEHEDEERRREMTAEECALSLVGLASAR